MHRAFIILFLAVGMCFGQSMTEAAAAAAGGSIGGVGGKKVSDALSTIFGKVDQQTSKAAKTTPAPQKTPLLETGPAALKLEPGAVPPPPPLPGEHVTRRAAVPVVKEIVPEPVVVPGPPPPQMTAADLRNVTPGMNRDAVLQMGQPAERITMVENGHLVETYSYVQNDAFLGRVHLSDGAVASADLPK